MAQGFLQMLYRDTSDTQVSVFRVLNGVTEKIGSSFGSRTAVPYAAQISYNKVCYWRNNLYARNNNEIWKYDVLNNTDWTLFHTIGNSASISENGTGFFLTQVKGRPVIACGVVRGVTDTMTIAIVDEDENVTEQISPTIMASLEFADAGTGMKPINHKNSILWWSRQGANVSSVGTYDVDSNSYSKVLCEAAAGVSMAVWNGDPYVLEIGVSTQRLHRLIGGTLSPFASFGAGGTTKEGTGGNSALLIDPDNNKAYCFFAQNAVGADIGRCFEVDSSGVVQDVGATILPSEFREFGGLDNGLSRWRWCVRADTSIAVGTPDIFIDITPDVNTISQPAIYKWNGPDTAISFVSNGPSAEFSQVSLNNGSDGFYTWPGSGILSTSTPIVTNNSSDVTIEFELFGPLVAATGVSVELRFGRDGGYAIEQGLLNTPSAGVMNGNIIQGLTADNGATTYSVHWDVLGDSIENGSTPRIALRPFLG